LRYLLALVAFASSAVLAQAPPPAPAGKDAPSAEQRRKIREAQKKASVVCRDASGEAHRDCMEREMCAQARDPVKCDERVAKVREAHQKAVESCKGAQPDQHRDCMRHEMCAHAEDPLKCEARAKEAAERRKPATKPSN
jgi:hypothetical protein